MRRKTRAVKVGKVGVGGDNPIRIQSMTTSSTSDVEATVDQIVKLADEGCDIARVTVQGMKEADACEGIKNGLIKKGYEIPLVADIHFFPPAAMRVADFADKVRINPGNYVDKRAQFKVIEYDDATYALEIERIEEKFTPLVEKCKRLGRAMRIGVNHGSLSDRIMNKFGDTAIGMVESAIEFAEVCRKLNYHDIIFSMKASNTCVMIQAYRLLVQRMDALGWDYPLHLGVTEAGEGEDGRVKSAIGMGALLLDGMGDTIRVSLTEDPWHEIDPCRRLAQLAQPVAGGEWKVYPRRESYLHRDGAVILKVSLDEIEDTSFFESLGCSEALGQPVKEKSSVDAVIATHDHPKLDKLERAGIRVLRHRVVVTEDESTWELARSAEAVFFQPSKNPVFHARRFFAWLPIDVPVILNFSYALSEEDVRILASAHYGSLLTDGCGVGICLEAGLPLDVRYSLSFSILQGARMRSSKTEFISCPGCGRTLFDLQEVARKIREKTGHLPGVKIAIMGCIVNGPGEMADADFGYVGSRPGKIDLYVGKTCVQKNIEMDEAEERLIELIKKHDRWVEPSEEIAVL